MERRLNEVVNRLNKTKEEKTIDYAAEKAARLAAEKARRKNEIERAKAEEERERRRVRDEAELQSYGSVFKEASMSSNKHAGPVDPKKFEDDFF